MITKLVTLTGWSPIVVKLALLAVASGAIFYGIYRYGTSCYNDGDSNGFKRSQQMAEEKFKEREAALLRELATAKAKYNKEVTFYEDSVKLLTAQQSQLLRERHALDVERAKAKATSEASIAAGHAAAAALTDRDAADRITALAKQLAADSDWRKRIPAGAGQPTP